MPRMTPTLATPVPRPSSRSQTRFRFARLAMPSETTPRTNATGTAYDASSRAKRCDCLATTTAAGMVRTPATPSTNPSQARRLLLSIGPATRRGRDRPADHAGDSDQGQHVRKRLDEAGRVPPRLAEAECQRGREPEQQRRCERAERTPVAEDQGGET